MEKMSMEIEFLLKPLTEEEINASDVVSKGTGLVIVAKVEDLVEEAEEAGSEIVVSGFEIGAVHHEDVLALPGVDDIHHEAQVEVGAQVTVEARVQEEIDEGQMPDVIMKKAQAQAQARPEMQRIEARFHSLKERKVQAEIDPPRGTLPFASDFMLKIKKPEPGKKSSLFPELPVYTVFLTSKKLLR